MTADITDKLFMSTEEPVISAMNLAGYKIHRHIAQSLLSELHARYKSGHKTLLFFANANFVVQCRHLRELLAREDVIIVNDGVGMDMAAKIVHGQKFFENLNGTDFVPLLLHNSAKPFKVFLYGGKPESVAGAAKVISDFGHNVVGYLDGYQSDSNRVLNKIQSSGADIVLVAMGNPQQESWILQHANALSPKIFIGVGALFDFLSGRIQRAPRWVRKMRMEWFYRLCREPQRLGRRYTVDIFSFFKMCLREAQKKPS